ncbi:unnamed protein product [Sphenostylis stenocarpa]|uniref:Uncharacterized protein n=1 Tax=Sphenostylis stenocarpa TaxID=92480 RepID=A0AA86VZ93_9FABA|nr:unnamed protein product [Sphenostylis stenocarpa]
MSAFTNKKEKKKKTKAKGEWSAVSVRSQTATPFGSTAAQSTVQSRARIHGGRSTRRRLSLARGHLGLGGSVFDAWGISVVIAKRVRGRAKEEPRQDDHPPAGELREQESPKWSISKPSDSGKIRHADLPAEKTFYRENKEIGEINLPDRIAMDSNLGVSFRQIYERPKRIHGKREQER